jgi:hypothetical protein
MKRQIDTTVVFSDPYTLNNFRGRQSPFDNILVRQFVAVDPVDYKTYVEVYTDDGYGNGNLLYRFEVVED